MARAGDARGTAEPHDEAYKLGLAGKPLPSRLLRGAETDESILDSWREGKSDRPGDQPDAPAPKAEPETQPEPRPAPAPAPRARKGSPAPRKDRVRRSAGARRPSSSGRRRQRPGRPTLGDPTGGRVPLLSFDGEGLGGLFIGAVAYALLLSIVNYGPKGPGLWFKAKFLNQAAGSSSSSTTATANAAPATSSPTINLA